MEYAIYVYLAILTIILAFKGTTTQSKKLDYLLFVSLIALSLVVRQTPHSDIPVYIDNMKVSLSDMLRNMYWLKNIVYWGTTSILYHLGLSPFTIFLILDTLSFWLILKARNNKNIPYYFIPLYYVCFIGIFGLQNIYRQYLASVLLIYIYTIIREKPTLGYLLFAIAILIHNSSFIMAGILYLEQKEGAINKHLYVLTLLLAIPIVPYIFSTDYMYNTGQNYNLLYLVIVSILTIFIIFSIRLINSLKTPYHLSSQSPIYLVFFAISAYFTMGTSLYYERLMLVILPFLILFTANCIKFYKIRNTLNLAFAIGLIIPTFTFQATQAMLNNAIFLLDD